MSAFARYSLNHLVGTQSNEDELDSDCSTLASATTATMYRTCSRAVDADDDGNSNNGVICYNITTEKLNM